jgi:superfamily II DNA or RNA helicase
VSVNPLAMRIRTERFRTMVILDEIHHAGDAKSWGEGVLEAFGPASRRLALTGTPVETAGTHKPDGLGHAPTSIFHKRRVDYERVVELIPPGASVLDLRRCNPAAFNTSSSPVSIASTKE